MTREEQIAQASIEYTMQRNPMCLGGDNFSDQVQTMNRNYAFEAGVKWADEHPNLSSLWHKAKEKPTEEYCRILCEDSEGEIFDASLLKINATYQSDWEAFIKEWDVVRWAYLWDILP